MNQWQNGQTDGLFNQQTPTHLNPSMFSNLNAAGQFDLNGASPFQQQQSLANGNSNNAFQNAQSFQTGSVVPQKRPHDGMSASPPPPNQTSRSATPNFNAFANAQQAQQFSQGATPTPYGHLQQTGSAQATPSPTMSSQQFRNPSRMSNASPSPFPQQGQAQFNNQMSSAQAMGQQMNNMGQFGMNAAAMGMNNSNANNNNNNNNMSTSMPNQSNGMTSAMVQQQRQYQLRLMQQQAAMRQQQQNGNSANNASSPANTNSMMSMQQMQSAMNSRAAMQQQQQMKRAQFLQQCGAYVVKSGRQFSPNHSVQGKPVDLYNLFTCVVSAGGSGAVDRNNQWGAVAAKLGLDISNGTAAMEIKQIFLSQIALYEKAWLTAKASQKQEQARLHAQQMAGFAASGQTSPTKSMQPPNPAQTQVQPQTFNQFQQAPPTQVSTPQPPQQQTPVQSNASLPQNGGASTPQSMMNAQHRRNSSMRKPDGMTPQPTMPSPQVQVQHEPQIKSEPAVRTPLKRDVGQSTNYQPAKRTVAESEPYAVDSLSGTIGEGYKHMPPLLMVPEMGIIDVRAISLSLASGLHAEVRYALETLALVTVDGAFIFELEKCEDLIDIIADCAESQTDILADKSEEVSDSIDLPSYEDVLRNTRSEAESLQETPRMGSQGWDLDSAAEKVIAITTILRNLSFHEHNHRLLTSAHIIKWLSHTLRLIGTRHMFLRSHWNLQDFYKDAVIFLSNTTQAIELASRDDALHFLHFLLTFTPQPVSSYTQSDGKLNFGLFIPTVHHYLPPAIDSLAKLLARADPNRVLYKSIFSASNGTHSTSDEDPIDLLTRAFALSISVLPDRNKLHPSNSVQLLVVDTRKAYLTQGMLAADILTSLLPSGESDIARAWLESEDGWASNLLNLASLLSVDHLPRVLGPKTTVPWDIESFRYIAQRALSMMKRLAEKAGKGSARRLMNGNSKSALVLENGDADNGTDHTVSGKKWEGIPQRHTIIGAMSMRGIDKTALGLMCGLHDLAAQS